MTDRIEVVSTRLFKVPLAEVLVDAKHGDHTHFELITATVRTKDGVEGTGYTYTGGRGGQAILAML
ncbi:MAG: uroporphyrinogen decarboxylase, partial [Pseudomonadota bacterium]